MASCETQTPACTVVERTYLQMLVPPVRTNSSILPDVTTIHHVVNCPASFYRYLYAEVGRGYHWTDRLGLTDEEIRAHIAAPGVDLFCLWVEGSPAGYYELWRHDEDDSVEVGYFGLLPEFVGKGYGRLLLEHAVGEAWERGQSRVWLHTCTLDHPAAITNYLARGFEPYRTETYETVLAATSG